ncbi:MAG: Zinc ribbon domain protein [Syntrophorhabdus sp. PtaU1.Bin050]|jgi:putative FmdB family regulatory protein|nr:MAG: Zinc ribbon domain protein [Syntrophorhabdus sp. PtaU1.Bin050]
MPIFEYVCDKCKNEFEVIVFKDDEPSCPVCGDKNPTKKMSSFGFSVGFKFKASSSGSDSGSGCSTCGSSNCSSCH